MGNPIVNVGVVPHQPNGNHLRRAADTEQEGHIFVEPQDNEKNLVARHELWYTESEYYSMRRATIDDALEVRARTILAGARFSYSGNEDDVQDEETSVCCIGIEHLISPVYMLRARACRARCIRAVLEEQARQGSSQESVALASLAQTRNATVNARMLGRLLQDSI